MPNKDITLYLDGSAPPPVVVVVVVFCFSTAKFMRILAQVSW